MYVNYISIKRKNKQKKYWCYLSFIGIIILYPGNVGCSINYTTAADQASTEQTTVVKKTLNVEKENQSY